MSVKLNELLPAPTAVTDDWTKHDPWFKQHEEKIMAVAVKEPPSYGKRSAWIPRNENDFGDGGAFPEIHVAQFPLGMGKGTTRKGASNTLALQVDSEGKIRYDAIARVGHDKDKIVYTKLADAKGSGPIDEESVQKPDEEDIREVTEKTRAALEKLASTKIAAALPVRHAEKQGPVQYIRYTPSQQGANYNSGAQQRIIRMVEAQVDPMEPPKFKINQKIPRPPPSPPAPVMHSPTRKVTVKEQQEWKIPPCISNWKNSRGYTIPLDKRLAADGRGLQQVHINENFSKLAEALYIADRKAREAVEMRAQLEKRVAKQKKEEQEEKMRQLAQKAREERAGIRRQGGKHDDVKEADKEVKERDELRHERAADRRRDRNIARAAPDKQAKLRRNQERDISEQIALGMPDTKARSNETRFDERLYGRSKGLDSGHGLDDETYAVYDKPWRTGETAAQHLYRPSKNLDKDIYGDDLDKLIKTNKFVPDKGFQGADGGPSEGAVAASSRDGPVQFERQQPTAEEDDPFGLGQLLKTAKEGGKRKAPAAAATSAAGDRDRERESKRRK